MNNNDDYMQRVRERFYKQVRETNWGAPEECVYKARGRKPKERVVYESKPRTAFEKVAMGKYNWIK
jgi:hypothetical protein